jgi:hypothetical protein
LEVLGEGTHIAVLYSDRAERDAHLIPYLSAAARVGKSSVCVASDEPEDLRRQVDGLVPGSSGQLEVFGTDTTYLRDGEFARAEMTEWLESFARAVPVGSPGRPSHIAGDINWLSQLDSRNHAELHTYEASLDSFASGCRHTFACFYDALSLPAPSILSVFRTHRKVVTGGVLWESPFYAGQASPVSLRPARDDQRPAAAMSGMEGGPA